MNKIQILTRIWNVLTSALAIILLIGITIPIIKHIRLKGEKADIEFIGPYEEDASIRTAISLGQYKSINDKRGAGALITRIRYRDIQNYIPQYEGRTDQNLSLLWFYRFTPLKLKRAGNYLEVFGTSNTNETFSLIIASYNELEDVRIMQTMESK